MIDHPAAQICKRLGSLKALRQPHEPVWRDCFDHTYPIRGDGLDSSISNAMDVQARIARLADSTLTDSARLQASAIMSGMTPANSRWFGMDVGQETDEERVWFDDSAQTLWENIHAANFDAAGYEGMIDLVCAGWFCMYIDEDRERGGFTFQLWPISSVYCATSKAGGTIDTVYRCYKLSAEQAAAEFGIENLSEATQKLAREKPDEQVEFVHAIQPRSTYVIGAKLAKNMAIASYHVEVGQKKMARESGYHEMPVVVPRWMQIPNSVYAIGPTSEALPDARTLNTLVRMELANCDLAIAGMWIAEDDGVLNPRTVKVGPRKIIVANSVDSMKPLQTGADFNVAFTKADQLRASIRKVMMADQLQPQDGPAMTATEVHVRVALIRQLLGPVYGRLQAEYLQALIERCFGIAYRAGVFAPAPQSLANREFTVRYISPLARAQKLEEVSAIDQFVAGAAQAAQVQPDVLDNVDFDAAARFRGEALGVPSSIIRSKADVQAKRDERQQQQQQAQQQAIQQQVQLSAGQEAAKQVVNQ
jgi:hypothetical protein